MNPFLIQKVLLVEDSVVLGERIGELIREIPEMELVDVVDSESAALSLIDCRHVDIILLDLHLRQGTGFGILRAMAGRVRKPRIIVLTNHDLLEYQTAAIALGATAFLDKARDFARLPELLRVIARMAGQGNGRLNGEDGDRLIA